MNSITINQHNIKDKIYTIRDLQVMLDKDLSELYGVETKVFNQAVKRNIARFPEHFRFQLTKEEADNLRSQSVTSNSNNSLRSQIVTLESQRGKYSKYLPYVFSEQGISMLSAILKSDTAIEISIKIIDSFVQMRKLLSQNNMFFQRFENIEQKLLKHDEAITKVFEAIESKDIKPKQGIFYNGQIFDAYSFIADLIREAKQSITLIDNYVDDSVLTLFSKNQDIEITIYTSNISKQLKQDVEKYNSQYKNITLKIFKDSHDRFFIIDNTQIYHIGASLKDLGKKWFAFSKLNIEGLDMLKNLKKGKTTNE